MDRLASLTALAELLERIRAAREDDARALMSEVRPGLHKDANDVWANVWHYVSDYDIRARDAAYRDMQEEHMDKLIRALRAGAPRSELLRYHFLA